MGGPNFPGTALAYLIRDYTIARKYQRSALNKLLARNLRGLVSLPTGTGKTLVGMMAAAAAIASGNYPVLVLAPTNVLVAQWRNAAKNYLGGMATTDPEQWLSGKYPVLITTYQYALLHPDIIDKAYTVIVDEAHHFRVREPSSYKQLAEKTAKKDHVIGLTPVPADVARETGVSRVFGGVAYAATYKDLAPFIQGFFIDIREFNGAKVEDVPAGLVASIAKELAEENRRKIIVFSNTFSKAREIEEELKRVLGPRGYKVILLAGSSHMTRAEQEKRVREFEEAEKAVLVGTTVLNEGVNVPSADAAIIATPTRTEVNNIQRIGRVVRLAEKELVPIIYVVPRYNTDLRDKILEMIEKYYAEEDRVGSETRARLIRMERQLLSRLPRRAYPVPEDIALHVGRLLVVNPMVLDENDRRALQEYLFYYYLNTEGDPGKAYRSWLSDVKRETKQAGSIRSWILSPGQRPGPKGTISGKDYPGIDMGDEESLRILQETQKEVKKMAESSEEQILAEKYPGLRELLSRVYYKPLSTLGPEESLELVKIKLAINPELVRKDIEAGYAGYCSVADWLTGVCVGVPPSLRVSDVRRVLRELSTGSRLAMISG